MKRAFLFLWHIYFCYSFTASAAIKSPHGIFELNPKGWTNPAVQGVRLRLKWTDVQPDDGNSFQWGIIDEALAQAQAHHKQIGLSIAALAAAPNWLLAEGAKSYQLPSTRSGHQRSIVLPWDPIVQHALLRLTKELGARYDGKLDYIAMNGLGAVIESYITPNPATIGLSIEDAVARWSTSCNAIIDAHAAAFSSTPFIFTAAKPFAGPAAVVALKEVVGAAAKKYPGRFGIMDCSLNAHAAPRYVPHALVRQYSATNPVGLQFLCSTRGFGNHQLGGTLSEAMEAAIALKAQWVEVYPYDAQQAQHAATLTSAAPRLAPPAAR